MAWDKMCGACMGLFLPCFSPCFLVRVRELGEGVAEEGPGRGGSGGEKETAEDAHQRRAVLVCVCVCVCVCV
jgi:hypothetical protein